MWCARCRRPREGAEDLGLPPTVLRVCPLYGARVILGKKFKAQVAFRCALQTFGHALTADECVRAFLQTFTPDTHGVPGHGLFIFFGALHLRKFRSMWFRFVSPRPARCYVCTLADVFIPPPCRVWCRVFVRTAVGGCSERRDRVREDNSSPPVRVGQSGRPGSRREVQHRVHATAADQRRGSRRQSGVGEVRSERRKPHALYSWSVGGGKPGTFRRARVA